MSASEKLKALEVAIARHGGPDPNHKAAFYAHIRYLDALPQIVAVVEAAENADAHLHDTNPELDAEQFAYLMLSVAHALAELEKALP